MQPIRYRPRNQFLRAFAAWTAANQHGMPFNLKLTQRRDRCLAFNMVGVNPALIVAVMPEEVRVDVVHEGYAWDILACFEAVGRRDPDGYRCALCIEPEPARPTREALWADHCFEPLRAWMQDSLAPATWLTLDGEPGATTWAALASTETVARTVRTRLLLHSR